MTKPAARSKSVALLPCPEFDAAGRATMASAALIAFAIAPRDDGPSFALVGARRLFRAQHESHAAFRHRAHWAAERTGAERVTFGGMQRVDVGSAE
jgi:hypothetical protein